MKELVKLVVFVPEPDADMIRRVLGEAGAGRIGEYSFCSFSTKGVGRFLPSEQAKPHIGSGGKMESVSEERIEVVCEKDLAPAVMSAVMKAHPYEEVAFDVYPMINL